MKKKIIAVVLTVMIVLSSVMPVLANSGTPTLPPIPTRVQLCDYTPY